VDDDFDVENLALDDDDENLALDDVFGCWKSCFG
jgi:hypothetical protein